MMKQHLILINTFSSRYNSQNKANDFTNTSPKELGQKHEIALTEIWCRLKPILFESKENSQISMIVNTPKGVKTMYMEIPEPS